MTFTAEYYKISKMWDDWYGGADFSVAISIMKREYVCFYSIKQKHRESFYDVYRENGIKGFSLIKSNSKWNNMCENDLWS